MLHRQSGWRIDAQHNKRPTTAHVRLQRSIPRVSVQLCRLSVVQQFVILSEPSVTMQCDMHPRA